MVDSDDLLDHTEEIVRIYCERTDLAFRPDTLEWAPRIPKEWQLTERWPRFLQARVTVLP
ncbi:hypothetical protein ACWD6R_24540 [Streptomyces sp. NPDC005151]